jgi:hypothetical protein
MALQKRKLGVKRQRDEGSEDSDIPADEKVSEQLDV